MIDRINGIPIYINLFMTERWQYSRSPSRAKRRAAMGHRQHFADFPYPKVIQTAQGLFMHPVVYDALKARLRSSPLVPHPGTGSPPPRISTGAASPDHPRE